MRYKNRTNKQTNKHSRTNEQSKSNIKKEDRDDHSEDEDEEVVLAVHSWAPGAHSHRDPVEAAVHCIVAAERDVEEVDDHRSLVDAYRADNLLVVRSKAADVDYRREDSAVVAVAAAAAAVVGGGIG